MKGDAEGRQQQMRRNKDQSVFLNPNAAKRNYGMRINTEGGERVLMLKCVCPMKVLIKLVVFC